MCSQPPALCDLGILGVLSLWTCSIYSMSLEAVSELMTQLSTSLRYVQGDAPNRMVLNAPSCAVPGFDYLRWKSALLMLAFLLVPRPIAQEVSLLRGG